MIPDDVIARPVYRKLAGLSKEATERIIRERYERDKLRNFKEAGPRAPKQT